MKKPLFLLAATLLAATTACGAPAPTTPAQSPAASASDGAPNAGQEGTLTVFAAASLKGSFEKIATDFEAKHPGVDVKYSFEGSSTLVDQLSAGAPADVFASADEKNMTRAADAKLVTGTPKIFAANVLTLVVPTGNPGHITGLDASLEGKKLVVCAVGVPCGNATETLSKDLGVTLKPVSREQKVTDVLGKVTSGEADAGLVYTTDAKAAGAAVQTVPVPGAEKVVNKYPIAVTASTKHADLAGQYVDYVTSPEGQAVLAEFGFAKP